MNAPIVLAAEDEETDAFILRLAFEKAGVTNPLVILRDGQQIVDYLSGVPPYDDRTAHPLPAVLTLDLKMPRMNGFDVLTWLRARPEFKALPAVVISSSSDAADMRRARELGAWDYFVKPHRLEDFAEIIQSLESRWLKAR
jgi:CheY-like chemotaxis protein